MRSARYCSRATSKKGAGRSEVRAEQVADSERRAPARDPDAKESNPTGSSAHQMLSLLQHVQYGLRAVSALAQSRRQASSRASPCFSVSDLCALPTALPKPWKTHKVQKQQSTKSVNRRITRANTTSQPSQPNQPNQPLNALTIAHTHRALTSRLTSPSQSASSRSQQQGSP